MHHIQQIRFGTDGWRGMIAEDFTFENVRIVAGAIASYLRTRTQDAPSVVVGYDTRFHSAAFAGAIAEVLAGAGCRVVLSDRCISTPGVSSAVVSLKADGGVVVSASHNPPLFNGIKFKTPEGGSAPADVTAAFEGFVREQTPPPAGSGGIERRNVTPSYWKRVQSSVDFATIRRARLKLVVDPMFGAATGYMEAILKGTKCQVIGMHGSTDPLFGGLHPEPIEEYLGDLKKQVKLSGADAGLATDGDADRIGVVDEKGRYLTPHQVFPLLLHYLCHYKKLKGKVVQAISLGYVSERIARAYGLEFEEVPIGFKYIAERILREDVLIGGEESGGYGCGGYLPERDGILNSLLIIEMLAATGKSLSALLREIEKKFGSSAYLRTDFRNPGISKDVFVDTLKKNMPPKIAGLRVRQVKDYDGIEFVLEDDSWLLLRPSGTEPVIRVYCESETSEKTRRIISWGQQTVKNWRFP